MQSTATTTYQERLSLNISKTIAQKQALKKIIIFASIIACVVLAVNI